MTRCPRCRRVPPDGAPFCACGAPLLLGDESARQLDAAVELDRRGGRNPPPAAVAAAIPPPARAAQRAPQLAELARAEWERLEPSPPPAEPTALDAAPVRAAADVPDAEVDALEVHFQRAAGWRRALAWGVDAAPFALGGGVLARSLVREAAWDLAAPSGLDGLLDLAARERIILLSVAAAVALALAVYATLAHALAGATLGKALLRLRVIGPDGARPSPARSAARSALGVASAGALGLGFLLALFTRSGRALHDLIARTWVVKAP